MAIKSWQHVSFRQAMVQTDVFKHSQILKRRRVEVGNKWL
jgi:hypothetical protein